MSKKQNPKASEQLTQNQTQKSDRHQPMRQVVQTTTDADDERQMDENRVVVAKGEWL